MPIKSTVNEPVYSVAELVLAARNLLENTFPTVCVEGEISNLARPASGHLYFSLKDTDAQIRCALFRNSALGVRFTPANGQQVMARGRLSIYPQRGDFQLIVTSLEEAGLGALMRAFELLKNRLAEENLFALEHKKPLPAYPSRIGVVTSPTGAAIRDILHVLARRFPAADIIIYPTQVQGDSAPAEIERAIRLACRRNECDVLILARGGGSLEDLWAFNEERVARAIYAASLPIITGVGHETDTTIADFVSDLRTPTPSAAAEHAVPDTAELLQRLSNMEHRLITRWSRIRQYSRNRLAELSRRLQSQHPARRLMDRMQRVDELQTRLSQGFSQSLNRRQAQLRILEAKLAACSPEGLLVTYHHQLAKLNGELSLNMDRRLSSMRNRLETLARTLDAVSPLATVGRGYAILRDAQSHVVFSPDQVTVGDPVFAQLKHGEITARVESKRDEMSSENE